MGQLIGDDKKIDGLSFERFPLKRFKRDNSLSGSGSFHRCYYKQVSHFKKESEDTV